jgi:hypothetical protein
MHPRLSGPSMFSRVCCNVRFFVEARIENGDVSWLRRTFMLSWGPINSILVLSPCCVVAGDHRGASVRLPGDLPE